MDEKDFWERLEFRICRELQGFDDKHLRCHWCDGLVAEEYDLLGEQPCIRGRAWCGLSGQEPWRFVLLLAPVTRSREGIDWSALLPDDRATGWLSPDPQHKSMVIDPRSSHPD
ncbi:hypothetical protein [Polymorphospora rubra]|uniref:Uncharacterized protein n=1 Tax=Polymorphospora rubra TaxID=338584 RepID=A0A810MTZ9_9ACTN|nr:hypothetical protein [Polymorphospora rubra]BCJ63143.1 hypothetical protein Prubr_01640 [Polymorphospora rubra]